MNRYRYIDANKIKYSDFDLSIFPAVLKNIAYKEDIDKIPTADVEPIRYGKWVYHETVLSDDGIEGAFECSCCGATVKENTFYLEDFHKNRCGECGAKMNEKEMDR